MKASELFVKCLENEKVEYIFGIPGEENIDMMDALIDSDLQFITTRHEQGASFMADVYGRLTGDPGVCLATLGPGATNLVTGFADANMDRAPIIAIAGQGATTRMHKESHQILDLVNLFAPIAKYSTGIRSSKVIPEVVRKAFKVAKTEKPGGCFIDLPENLAKDQVGDAEPLAVKFPAPPEAPEQAIKQAADLLLAARFPLILVGNGVIRGKACQQLVEFAERVQIPVANTFMSKGCLPFSHPLSLGTVGLQANDYVACGCARADLIVCIGYDIVEYHPYLWHPEKDKKIIHIDPSPAEVDEYYIPECAVVGGIAASLERIAELMAVQGGPAERKQNTYTGTLRQVIVDEFNACAEDTGFPIKPQKILWDLRQALNPEDVVLSDVGAHKMWLARMYQAEAPNTCIISNGFASMGIALPGAIAAKLVHPDRSAVAVTGDAGFLMNSQEIETALRINTPIIILIWRDNEYGLITWHQMKAFGRKSNTTFTNPDFVKYAESFGAKGYRVQAADELAPILRQAIADDTVVVIDCPVDYSVNMEFTERMGQLICPI